MTTGTPEAEALAELDVLERAVRLADTLASDVPITASARSHIAAAYTTLASARTRLTHPQSSDVPDDHVKNIRMAIDYCTDRQADRFGGFIRRVLRQCLHAPACGSFDNYGCDCAATHPQSSDVETDDWTGGRAWPDLLESIANYWAEWEEDRAGRGTYTTEELAEDAGEFATGLADHLSTLPPPVASSTGERERVAQAIREHHRTHVRQPNRSNEPRRTFHQGEYEAADAILAHRPTDAARYATLEVAEDWTGGRAWPDLLEAVAAYWAEWEEDRAGRATYTAEELAEDAGQFATGLADHLAALAQEQPSPADATPAGGEA